MYFLHRQPNPNLFWFTIRGYPLSLCGSRHFEPCVEVEERLSKQKRLPQYWLSTHLASIGRLELQMNGCQFWDMNINNMNDLQEHINNQLNIGFNVLFAKAILCYCERCEPVASQSRRHLLLFRILLTWAYCLASWDMSPTHILWASGKWFNSLDIQSLISCLWDLKHQNFIGGKSPPGLTPSFIAPISSVYHTLLAYCH